uniref:Uncharacterized protein n=1 Tax=Panagrolaimus superbus TaxID=310955 RepID=A0A914YU49_9BILA
MVTQNLWSSRPEDRYTMNDVVQRLEHLTGIKQPAIKKEYQKSQSDENIDGGGGGGGHRHSAARRRSRREEDKGQSAAQKEGK